MTPTGKKIDEKALDVNLKKNKHNLFTLIKMFE